MYVFHTVFCSLFQAYDSVNKIYITGYVVSIIFLLVATSIFFFFRWVQKRKLKFGPFFSSLFYPYRRALRCVRNEIHTHLFVASILHNASWLLWYGAVIYRMDTIHMWTVSAIFKGFTSIALHGHWPLMARND